MTAATTQSSFAPRASRRPVESAALAARGGVLKVTPLTNGPLQIEGNLEICAGTGRTLNRVTETRLCRCGHSSNKPYCDGTHIKVGFVTT